MLYVFVFKIPVSMQSDSFPYKGKRDAQGLQGMGIGTHIHHTRVTYY